MPKNGGALKRRSSLLLDFRVVDERRGNVLRRDLMLFHNFVTIDE